jgi:hypothetical protein
MARQAVNTTAKIRVWVGELEVSAGVIASSIQAPNPLETAIVTATGGITLAQSALSFDVLDLDRTIFPIGSRVVVMMELPGGNLVHHPQGLLYVLGSEVSIEDRTITLDVGCSLALIAADELRYRTQLRSLFALADPAVRDRVQLEAYDLGELEALLTASGLVMVQNAWGTVWTVPVLDAIHSTTQPIQMTIGDMRTALAIEVLPAPSTRLPSRVVVNATAVVPAASVNDDYGCCVPDGDYEASGVMGANNTYRERQWETRTQIEATPIGYVQITRTGKAAPDTARDTGLRATGVSLVGPNPGNLASTPTAAELVWAYYIETPEILMEDLPVTFQVETLTEKGYDSRGLLTRETVTSSDRVMTGISGYYGAVLDLYDSERQRLVDEANSLYASANDLLTQRDGLETNSPDWYYLNGAAQQAIGEAGGHGADAQAVFALYKLEHDAQRFRVAEVQKVRTVSTYGAGGELRSKTVTTYLPELLEPSNLAELRTWAGYPEPLPGHRRERLVVARVERWRYDYRGEDVIERYQLDDIWQPLNNITTVRGSSNSSTAPAAAEQVYSRTAPAATLESPAGDALPGGGGTTTTYTAPTPSPCRSETTTLELQAVAPVGRSTPTTDPAGWLAADASYDLEIGYPLPFSETLSVLTSGRCYPPANPRGALEALMQQHAQRVALAVTAVSGGYVATEAMRPELWNWRPLMRVQLLLESIGESLACVTGAVTWGLEANNAVAVLELYPVGAFGELPAEPIEPFAAGIPSTQEDPIASGSPVPADPQFVYTPFATLISGPAPAVPGLVDSEGDPVALPNLQAGGWVPWLVPGATINAIPRPFCEISVTVRGAYSWHYGGIADVSGLPLHLGTAADPYATDYDFGGFAADTAPAALP